MPTSDKEVIKRLKSILNNQQVSIVGGAVRDRLLERPLYDFDFVVKKDPKRLVDQISSKLSGRAFVLDKERQVYRIVFKNSLQLDFSKIQGPSFDADLDRRDYSINSLSIPLDKWNRPNWITYIVDRHHGLRDLRKKQLIPISTKMLKEDPLRCLRAFRIGAELGFKIPQKTLSAIKRDRKFLKKCAPERIREELLKLFSQDCFPYLKQMDQARLWEIIYPESRKLKQTGRPYYGKGGVFKHTLETIHHIERIIESRKSWFPAFHKKIELYVNQSISGYPRLAHLKWAALLHDVGKPKTAKMIKGRLRFFNHDYVGADQVTKMAKRYRWSSDETSRYAKLVRYHMRPGNLANHLPLTNKATHRFFRDLQDDAIGMLLVSLGDHLSYLSPMELKKRDSSHEKITISLMNRFYRGRKKVLPPKLIDGNDVMNKFKLKPSPLIGTCLKEIQEKQSEGKIKTKKDALDYLKNWLVTNEQR